MTNPSKKCKKQWWCRSQEALDEVKMEEEWMTADHSIWKQLTLREYIAIDRLVHMGSTREGMIGLSLPYALSSGFCSMCSTLKTLLSSSVALYTSLQAAVPEDSIEQQCGGSFVFGRGKQRVCGMVEIDLHTHTGTFFNHTLKSVEHMNTTGSIDIFLS